MPKNNCYICKEIINDESPHSKRMCFDCGAFNYSKRYQTVNLTGYKALVTGGRVKIGYETVLKLLRAGAEVITTSRFPKNTICKYKNEKDYADWESRLFIYGLDFRHIPTVEKFINDLIEKVDNLDIIINNSAQTIRRPPVFYKHLMENESHLKSKELSNSLLNENDHSLVDNSISPLCNLFTPSITHLSSAQFTQIPLLPEDKIDSKYFPEGRYDKDGQQEDRRDFNSWMMKLEDVSLVEFIEVYYVNVVAPFLFNSRLKACMNKNRKSYVINVTAMEGNFYSPEKSVKHPHTNMAKAALNMMTRTSASNYALENIFMNSVDVGWITNEKPYPLSMSASDRVEIMTIDEIDGAARIMDPIITSVLGDGDSFGKLFKNFKEYPW